jgi:hypothetical protein
VQAVLQRAFQHELLARVEDVIGGGTTRSAVGDGPAQRSVPEHGEADRGEPEHGEPDRGEPLTAADPGPTAPSRAAAPGNHGLAEGPSPSGSGTYVFGFTRTSVTLEDDLPSVPGGGPIRAVDRAELRAVVCDADAEVLRTLEDLSPDDLDDLAAAAHAHDEVLARVATQAPVVPLRLGTVLADDGVVTDLLAANGEVLEAELDRFEGHAEWAVVVHIPDREPEAAAPETEAGSGGDYLRRRQASLSAREGRWEARTRLADEVHQRLSRFAVAADVVERRPLEQVPPALHGVYLLAWDRIGPFEDAVDEARAAHPEAIIEATGPWPAYHFTSVDLSLGDGTRS